MGVREGIPRGNANVQIRIYCPTFSRRPKTAGQLAKFMTHLIADLT